MSAHAVRDRIVERNPLLRLHRVRLHHMRTVHGRDPGSWVFNAPDRYGCMDCLRSRRRRFQSNGGPMGRYAWGVPDDAALDLIRCVSPGGVVEVGAGTGYWARLLMARGVDVRAYDLRPPSPDRDEEWNQWHRRRRQWHPVHPGDAEVAGEHPGRTLLLCWPPMGDGAYRALRAYESAGGRTVVYVGEVGGCTADERFESRVGLGYTCWSCRNGEPCDRGGACAEPTRWTIVGEHLIPTWWGLHDQLYVARRPGP